MKKSSIRKTWNVISSILVALVVLLALIVMLLRLLGEEDAALSASFRFRASASCSARFL